MQLEIDMKLKQVSLISIIALCTYGSLAFGAPPAGQAVGPSATQAITPMNQQQRKAVLVPCIVDLSIQRVRITRPTPTGPWLVGVIIKNLGTSAFDAPPAFTGLVVEETIGTYVHGWPAGDISNVPAGAEISMSYTIVHSEGAVRAVRAFLNFGPDAPACGLDINSANNALGFSGAQISEWSASPQLALQVRR
jgi:hypothetical protein